MIRGAGAPLVGRGHAQLAVQDLDHHVDLGRVIEQVAARLEVEEDRRGLVPEERDLAVSVAPSGRLESESLGGLREIEQVLLGGEPPAAEPAGGPRPAPAPGRSSGPSS